MTVPADTTAPVAAPAGPPERGRIDFVELADHLRVIKVSPAWTEVERAMTTLLQAEQEKRPLAQLEEEISYVRRFSELLRQSAGLIADAMLSGAALGAIRKEATRGERMLHGLSAISKGYRFEELPDEDVAKALAAVRRAIAKRFPPLREWSEMAPPLLANDDLDAWRLGVEQRLDALDGVLPAVTFDRVAYRAAAWDAWRTRMNAHLGSGEHAQPTLDELLCGAAGMRPTSLLRFDLRRVALGEWGAVFSAALEGLARYKDNGAAGRYSSAVFSAALEGPAPADEAYCPPWMAPVALHALGFRLSNVNWGTVLQATDFSDGTLEEDLMQWSWLLAGEPPRANALLIKQSRGSLFDEWLPTAGLAILPLTSAQISSQISRLSRSAPLSALGITRVLVEMPDGADGDSVKPKDLESIIHALQRGASETGASPVRPVFVYKRQPAEPPPGECIVAPRQPEDIMAGLLRTSTLSEGAR